MSLFCGKYVDSNSDREPGTTSLLFTTPVISHQTSILPTIKFTNVALSNTVVRDAHLRHSAIENYPSSDLLKPRHCTVLTIRKIHSKSARGEGVHSWPSAPCPPTLFADSVRAEVGRRSHPLLRLPWSRPAIPCLCSGLRPRMPETVLKTFCCGRRIQTEAGRCSWEMTMTAPG